MSAIGPQFVALLLGLAGPVNGIADLPAGAVVIAEALDVFDEPDETSSAPLRLARGDRVVIRAADRPGWLAIEPPSGSFCWIEQSAITPDPADPAHAARVTDGNALIRSGHPTARMPGTPRLALPEGTRVRLANRPPLTLGRGAARRTWRAIEPPPGDVRHVRAEGVCPDVEVAATPAKKEEPDAAPIAETRTGYAPRVIDPPVTPGVADAIAEIESLHRAILREPVERWQLEGVRQRYETLLRNVTDAGSGNAIRARLEMVARHEAMAREARLFASVLEQSRRRDAALEHSMRRLAEAGRPQDQPYDFRGLLQPSSRKVGGQKVFALIGRDGSTLAYLEIPPGLDVHRFMTRRVGVRGTVNYDEDLRARLIRVRNLEPLDGKR